MTNPRWRNAKEDRLVPEANAARAVQRNNLCLITPAIKPVRSSEAAEGRDRNRSTHPRPAMKQAGEKEGELMQKSIRNLLCAAAVALPLAAATNQPVRTASGPVSGVPGADPSVVAYQRNSLRGSAGRRSALARAEAAGRMDGGPQGRSVRQQLHPEHRGGAQALDARVHGAQQDQRRLPVSERVDPGEDRQRQAAGVLLDSRRRLRGRLLGRPGL